MRDNSYYRDPGMPAQPGLVALGPLQGDRRELITRDSADYQDQDLPARPGPADSGPLPGDRRKLIALGSIDYQDPGLPDQPEVVDDVVFMQQRRQGPDGWFLTAKIGFSRLQAQHEGKRAALTLRDRLRRVQSPEWSRVLHAHLPDILDAPVATEGEMTSSEAMDAETWVSFVLGELARVAGLPATDRDILLRTNVEVWQGDTCPPSSSASATPYGIFHAAWVWPNGTWSTREDLRQADRHDLLPCDHPISDEEGSEQAVHDADGTSLFQLGARDTTWADLMEQLWTWFEAGLQVEIALAMLRQRTLDRRESAYTAWVEGPLRTVGAGVDETTRASTDTTPPMFYRWSQRVEAHLYAAYIREELLAREEQGDESSMMDRGRRGGRRRSRSHTPRRDRGWHRPGDRRERVTEEVRYLGGGRSSGSRPAHANTNLWSREAHRGDPPSSGRACLRRDRDAGRRDVVPVVNEAAGIPDLSQPMTVTQAVDMWRYLLFAKDTYTNPRGPVPLSWLPLPMLRDVQVHLESMSQHNLAIMTVGLMTMLRYLMAELSQTMDFAQVVMNSRTDPTDFVELDADEPEPEDDGRGDVTSMMQSFFATSGKDSMDRRWARAILRLHKELEGQAKPMRTRSLALLRSSVPTLMLSLSAAAWMAQLQAVLVASQEGCADTEGGTPPPDEWIRGWIKEIGEFIPGFQLRQVPQMVDSLSEQELDELIQDEADERRLRAELEARDADEEARREAHDLLCQQEAAHLQAEAADYRAWERQMERDSLKRDLEVDEGASSKRLCHMTVEVATGSADRPQVLHTLGFTVPTDGTTLTMRFRANLESAPSEVSTVPVVSDSVPRPTLPQPEEEQDVSLSGTGEHGRRGAPSDSICVARDTQPNLLGLIEFEEYSLLYDRWRRGELTQQDIQAQYGAEVAELMLAQEAMNDQADDEDAEDDKPPAPIVVPEGAKGIGMYQDEAGVWRRHRFGRFEVVYGQWKAGYRSSEQVQICYGDTWLALFKLWKVWGLDAVWPSLHKVLDVLEDCIVVVGREFQAPETLDMPLRVPWSTVKMFCQIWLAGSMQDEDVVTRFGEIWLVIFQRLRAEGLPRTRGALTPYVEWDVDKDDDEATDGAKTSGGQDKTGV